MSLMCEPDTITKVDVITICAILVGPIVGVWLATFLEDMRARNKRRWEIFSVLMRTRNMRLSQDHVGALNLVEIEFAKNRKIIKAWKDYIEELSAKRPNETPESILQKRNNLLTKLLDEIAKVLKMKIDQISILEGNYIPQGWQDQEDQSTFLRNQIIKVLQGQSSLPISVVPNLQNTSLFPPAPVAGED